jgi:alginate O-acetyltransferase complex protein AlgI
VIERAGLGAVLGRAPVWAARVYALAAIMSGWVWFRARDAEHALSFFASLAGFHGPSGLSITTHIALHPATITALVIGTVLAGVEFDVWRAIRAVTVRLAQPVYALGDTVTITAMLALSILSIAAGSYSPFLYFRF